MSVCVVVGRISSVRKCVVISPPNFTDLPNFSWVSASSSASSSSSMDSSIFAVFNTFAAFLPPPKEKKSRRDSEKNYICIVFLKRCTIEVHGIFYTCTYALTYCCTYNTDVHSMYSKCNQYTHAQCSTCCPYGPSITLNLFLSSTAMSGLGRSPSELQYSTLRCKYSSSDLNIVCGWDRLRGIKRMNAVQYREREGVR